MTAEAPESAKPKSRKPSAALHAALWMVLSSAAFAGLVATVRQASQYLHFFEITFFRCLFGFLFMMPWLARAGIGALRTQRLPLYLLRAVIGLCFMTTWFWSISITPMAIVTSLFFASTLFAAVLAVLVLREKVGPRRWAAMILGFLGVLVILRPGVDQVTFGAMLSLGAAGLAGISMTVVKLLSRTERPEAIITYMALLLIPLSLVPALFVWVWPSWEVMAWLVAVSGFATVGHWGMTRSFGLSDSSAVMPFMYAQLPFVAAIGFVVYGEVPDMYTWIGGGIIAASSLYIARREAIAARDVQAPAASRDGAA
jgi:drug/metabolite transporter (DMT)-like permease